MLTFSQVHQCPLLRLETYSWAVPKRHSFLMDDVNKWLRSYGSYDWTAKLRRNQGHHDSVGAGAGAAIGAAAGAGMGGPTAAGAATGLGLGGTSSTGSTSVVLPLVFLSVRRLAMDTIPPRAPWRSGLLDLLYANVCWELISEMTGLDFFLWHFLVWVLRMRSNTFLPAKFQSQRFFVWSPSSSVYS